MRTSSLTLLGWVVVWMVTVSARAAEGPGGGGSLKLTRKCLLVSPHESATVGDLNRDGQPDIVPGPYWFAGPHFVPRAFRANHASKDYLHTNSDHVYDVDKDGWPDIISGAWGQKGIFWYRNPGNGAAERGKPWEMHAPWEWHS